MAKLLQKLCAIFFQEHPVYMRMYVHMQTAQKI